MSHVHQKVTHAVRSVSSTSAMPVNVAGRHSEPIYKICVAGATETGNCGLDAYEAGKEVGRQIARSGAILVTGAAAGFQLYAAIGAKEEGGFAIGLSPASDEREHVEKYQMPLDYLDFIVYTGFGNAGRNHMLSRSADAVIVGCGKIGTINEFTIAYEDEKPIGILEGSWQSDKMIAMLINESRKVNHKVAYGTDPKTLVDRMYELIKKDKENLAQLSHARRSWHSTVNDLMI